MGEDEYHKIMKLADSHVYRLRFLTFLSLPVGRIAVQ